MTAAATAMKLVNRVSKTFYGRDLSAEVPKTPEIYDELEPFAFLLTARLVVLGVSLASVVLTGQHSGVIRYYAGRITLRYEYIDEDWLDRGIE